MWLQHTSKHTNTPLQMCVVAWGRARCNPHTTSWSVIDYSDDGVLGSIDLAKPRGHVLDAPRFAGWAVPEISKRAMYRA